MEPSGGSVDDFISSVVPAARQRDALRLVPLMQKATGHTPVLWGRIIGFGSYHYRYASGP
ncbi:hypothetical protein [Nesterenkonia lutea]|uniref:Uncharacterized protein n=1 Tax=Nesterenkonia lutea TaxID=272919 RepID=A0ABR9JCQ1_9MICC|nr:hypothetical protein [Nesterenkonia lutea]MBE1523716.1 hypothetical protein [Nesterenkonia lutea]